MDNAADDSHPIFILFYAEEYGYGIQFESYVADGIHEFYAQYDPLRDRVWICEHGRAIIGCLFCMHRDGGARQNTAAQAARPEGAAQLRYFLIRSEYRGVGLGKRLMELFMEHLAACRYSSAYLWTVNGLPAAASLYKRHGFKLVEEKPAAAFFNKPLREQRYELLLP